MQKQHITLNQIRGFEAADLAMFRKRIEKEAQKQTEWRKAMDG
jgi:hypothetical protein